MCEYREYLYYRLIIWNTQQNESVLRNCSLTFNTNDVLLHEEDKKKSNRDMKGKKYLIFVELCIAQYVFNLLEDVYFNIPETTTTGQDFCTLWLGLRCKPVEIKEITRLSLSLIREALPERLVQQFIPNEQIPSQIPPVSQSRRSASPAYQSTDQWLAFNLTNDIIPKIPGHS